MSDSQVLIKQVERLKLPNSLVERLNWCRMILNAYHELDLPELYAIEWMMALDSETDHFPVGVERDMHSEVSLAASDKRLIDSYEGDLVELQFIRDRLLDELHELSN